MKKLAKLSLSQNAEILNESQMKMILGKGYGLCILVCGSSPNTQYMRPYGSCSEMLEQYCELGGTCSEDCDD